MAGKKVKRTLDREGHRVVRIKASQDKPIDALEDLQVELANSQLSGVVVLAIHRNGRVRTRLYGEVQRDGLAMAGAWLLKWATED